VASGGVVGVAAGHAIAGGAEAAAGAGAGIGAGGAGATPEIGGGTGVTPGIARGQGPGRAAEAGAAEQLLEYLSPTF